MTPYVHHHAAFGCAWRADLPLPQFDDWNMARDDDAGVIDVRQVGTLALRTSCRGDAPVFDDGLRFVWQDQVTFDLYDGRRINYLPGPGWTGAMPASFYSTMAALTLAWRGALPCHASAVEIDGKAVLIAGAAGAGKSTLTAALLRDGARLIGDDLSVITRATLTAPLMVTRGRPTIRLHPDTAAWLPASLCVPVPGDDRGKWLARPLSRSTQGSVPLAGFVLLGEANGPLYPQDAPLLLSQQLFRPRWLRLLPGHAERLRSVFEIAEQVPCHGLTPSGPFHLDPVAAQDARRLIDAMIAA